MTGMQNRNMLSQHRPSLRLFTSCSGEAPGTVYSIPVDFTTGHVVYVCWMP